MTVPVLSIRVDRPTGAVIVTVSGPLATCEHVDALTHSLADVPVGYSMVIELDAMTTLSAKSLGCLRDMAIQATKQGIRLILVSASIDVRANLVLADLDSLVPVLDSLARATQILAAAA
ncbi:MAG: STAS domain-containing protein [Ilumatobacteraceae bacterium]